MLDKWLRENDECFGIHHDSVKSITIKFVEHYSFDKLPRRVKNQRQLTQNWIGMLSTSSFGTVRCRFVICLKVWCLHRNGAKNLLTLLTTACLRSDRWRNIWERGLQNASGIVIFLQGRRRICEHLQKVVRGGIIWHQIPVWKAVCSNGLKSSISHTKGTTIAEVYRTECLLKRMLPLWKHHTVHSSFWPDLVSAHYAKITVQWMQKNSRFHWERHLSSLMSTESAHTLSGVI